MRPVPRLPLSGELVFGKNPKGFAMPPAAGVNPIFPTSGNCVYELCYVSQKYFCSSCLRGKWRRGQDSNLHDLSVGGFQDLKGALDLT